MAYVRREQWTQRYCRNCGEPIDKATYKSVKEYEKRLYCSVQCRGGHARGREQWWKPTRDQP